MFPVGSVYAPGDGRGCAAGLGSAVRSVEECRAVMAASRISLGCDALLKLLSTARKPPSAPRSPGSSAAHLAFSSPSYMKQGEDRVDLY